MGEFVTMLGLFLGARPVQEPAAPEVERAPLPAKPRLRLRRGIWVCSMPTDNPWKFPSAMGHGYTPDQAYQEWATITQLLLR